MKWSIVLLIGIASASQGIWMISPPLAFISWGAMLVLISYGMRKQAQSEIKPEVGSGK